MRGGKTLAHLWLIAAVSCGRARLNQIPTGTRSYFTTKTSVHDLLDQEMRDRAYTVCVFHVWGIFSLLYLWNAFSGQLTHLSGTATFIVPLQCDKDRRKESTQQWLGPCRCILSATQETETICFWHQILWLDWWYLLCGYSAGVVSGPLGPCGIAPVAAQGGYLSSCPPILDGPGG